MLIKALYNEANCAGAVRDILQVVENDMLEINQLARVDSGELLRKLQKILVDAETNSNYLVS